MRLGWLMMATVAAATLAGCVGEELPPVAASAPPPAANGIGPDIQKILAAGGIDANQPAAPKGQVATLQPTAPSAPSAPAAASPSLQPPPPAAGVTQLATAERNSTRKRRKGDKRPRDEEKPVAVAREAPSTPLAPTAEAYASAPTSLLPAAPQPLAAVQPPAAQPGWVAAQPGVQSLPPGPTPGLSPNMAPIQTVRLPTVATSPDMIPPDAPRQAVVTSMPVNYNFLNGVGAGAQQQAAQPQVQQPSPQYPSPYPQQALLGAVAGPSPQQVLQPLLDPNTLLATPRGGRRQAVVRQERPARHPTREVAGRAPAPEARPQVAQAPAPPPPPAAPAFDSARPAVRRF